MAFVSIFELNISLDNVDKSHLHINLYSKKRGEGEEEEKKEEGGRKDGRRER